MIDEDFIGNLHLDNPLDDSNLDNIIRETRSMVEKTSERYARRIKQKVDNDARMLEKLSKIFHEIGKRSIELDDESRVDTSSVTSTIEHAQNHGSELNDSSQSEKGSFFFIF